MSVRIILLGLVATILLVSNMQMVDSVLWDLQIELNFEQNSLQKGDIPIVFGSVIDHAGKPVSEAEIKIRLGGNSVITTTDALGTFVVEFPEFAGIPGYYVVNVVATKGDKIGIKSSNFHVLGKIMVYSHTEKMLSTEEATKYLQASIEDFEKDPIGLILYNFYQDLQTKLLEEQSLQVEIDKQQQLIEEQRKVSLQLAEKIIEQENPGAGTYSGYKYDRFVGNLDDSVKEIFVNQLNYTVTVFEKAQKAKDEILENGGTWVEARQAYYENAAISRELMNSFTVINEIGNVTDSGNFTNTEIYSELEFLANSTEIQNNEDNTSFILNVNGTYIDVGKSGTVIYFSINGTIVELNVTGAQIEQTTNSSQN